MKATAWAKLDDEKITVLIDMLRSLVRNVSEAGVTDAERQKYFKSLPKDQGRTAAEIFESGLAIADEMNVVFAVFATVMQETRRCCSGKTALPVASIED